MTALVPVTCPIPAQRAATLALVRRIEASGRANADRHEAPQGSQTWPKTANAAAPTQPAATVAAQILGARYQASDAAGYGAYDKASRLLVLESHRLDVTLR